LNDVEYDYEEEEQLKLMYKAVYQLNDIEKALIFMYLEDKDYQEISETLGISEVNARVKMNRIKGKLKKILNQWEYERAGFIKKDWQKSDNSFNQISETEIYKMIHKKSSSIVKWILIISILEVLCDLFEFLF
jgi:DNA-binding CsgD family transcriptional regulator